MNNESCKTCQHYDFYVMITSGPYGYTGVIPCQRCSRFSSREDNYKPKIDMAEVTFQEIKDFMQ